MDEQLRTALGGVADEVLDVAERLICVGENLNELITGTEAGDQDAWMAGAKRELAEMIRAVEGPRPRQDGRE